MRKRSDGPPVRKLAEVAPTQRVPLCALSTLTWKEFVEGVQNDTVELPTPWTYPRERISFVECRPRLTDVIGLVQGPPNRRSFGYDTWWCEYPDHWLSCLVYGPYYPDNPALYVRDVSQAAPTIKDASFDFPGHTLRRYVTDERPLLILHHPTATLMPEHSGEMAYVIGPFDIAVAIEGSANDPVIHWEGVRTGSDTPGGGHPNLFPSPCYGRGDWGERIDCATKNQEWGELLFIIHSFLNSWNPNDYPLGHPEVLAVRREEWSGMVLDDIPDDEPQMACGMCGRPLTEDDVYTTLLDDLDYCESCYSECIVICYHCNNDIYVDRTRTWDEEAYCSSCYDRLFFSCPYCDEICKYSSNREWSLRHLDLECCNMCAEEKSHERTD